MFLDTSGSSGNPWRDEEPEEPAQWTPISSTDLAWLLGNVAIALFLGVFAFVAHYRGLDGQRDSWLLLMSLPGTAALCILTSMTFEWYMKEVPHPDE